MTTLLSRRAVLQQTGIGLGSLALQQMLMGSDLVPEAASRPGFLPSLHHPAKAKRVIYLFQSGGPSQMDLYDYKPLLNEKQGTELPDAVRQGQRLTSMSGNQSSLPRNGMEI